jgi:hypothetical protein
VASLATTGELGSVVQRAMCQISVVMADACCWRRTAAPPLRGYRMVGRVLMKRLPQFEGRRSRSCRVMATEVGIDRHGGCMVERGAEITSRPKITLCRENRNLEKGQCLHQQARDQICLGMDIYSSRQCLFISHSIIH